MEERVVIFHLKGKASIWWDHLVKLKDIDKDKISWKKFKYFKKEYLFEHYYDKKMEEFFDLKLGIVTMNSHEKKFIELL